MGVPSSRSGIGHTAGTPPRQNKSVAQVFVLETVSKAREVNHAGMPSAALKADDMHAGRPATTRRDFVGASWHQVAVAA
eukprot:204080-Rhodomonas_salina.2